MDKTGFGRIGDGSQAQGRRGPVAQARGEHAETFHVGNRQSGQVPCLLQVDSLPAADRTVIYLSSARRRNFIRLFTQTKRTLVERLGITCVCDQIITIAYMPLVLHERAHTSLRQPPSRGQCKHAFPCRRRFLLECWSDLRRAGLGIPDQALTTAGYFPSRPHALRGTAPRQSRHPCLRTRRQGHRQGVVVSWLLVCRVRI